MLKTAVFMCWNGLRVVQMLDAVCEVNHTHGVVHAILYICCEIRKSAVVGALNCRRRGGL